MFDSKRKTKVSESKTSAYEVSKPLVGGFIKAGLKISAETRSGNFAKKYSTTGDPFVDQFGKIGLYRSPRDFNEIAKDCEELWAINPKLSIIFIFYLRTITRIVTLFNGISTKVVQKGAQIKHESIMRMLWLSLKSQTSFWKNIGLFVSIGSWKDIITMLQYDYIYHGWDHRILDWHRISNLILTGLENPNTCDLIKKYLPQIKAKSRCTTIESEADTIIGKFISCKLFAYSIEEAKAKHYAMYRKLKSSGTAHQWQQLISQQKFDRIDFSKIHGRALSLLVKSKFLRNHNLTEKYAEWVKKPETKVKYTGFVHELFQSCDNYDSLVALPEYEQETINKQFDTLVQKGGEKSATKFIVVRDCSGSMNSIATGTNMSSGNVAKAIALYFSYFLTGAFSNSWIEFSRLAKLKYWKGQLPIEKWYNEDNDGYCYNTNFQSVIDLFYAIKEQGVAEKDFPTGILCISDGEFDQTSLDETNVLAAKNTLLRAGFSQQYVDDFVIVLWNIPNGFYKAKGHVTFETVSNQPNVFYFGGYEPSVISFLTDKIKTPRELFDSAMDQEILNMIEL
jgi:hypothetical protein